MKNYFIGQGTNLVAEFDTLEEMLRYHNLMPCVDKHFCKLYDRINKKIADGNDILFGLGWKNWIL